VTATVLQRLSTKQFISQTCKPNSAQILTAMRSYVVTVQFGGYLLSLSTTGQRSKSHRISLATNPPAFAPNSEFCASLNTKDDTIEIIVADWRASTGFQGYFFCMSESSLCQPHPTGYSYLGILESCGMLASVLALAGFGPRW